MSDSGPDAFSPVRPLRIMRALAPVTRFLLPPEIGKPPPDILADLRSVAEAARWTTREHLLRAGGEIDAFTSVIDALGAALAQSYEQQFEDQQGRDPELRRRLTGVECRRGCSFCCHMNVAVSPLEAVRIWAALHEESRHEQRDAMLAADIRLERRGTQDRLALKMLCPLLTDGACSIYELRPLACRALLSLSARLCEAEVDARDAGQDATRVPTLVTPRLIAAGIISGEVAALDDLGLASHLVELTAGVAVLMREPDI